MTRRIVEGAYVRDILGQPEALSRTVDRLEATAALRDLATRLREGGFRRVVLTGMGSSLYALYPLHLDLIACDHTSVWVDTSELIHYQSRLLDSRTLVVAVSQSGRSVETIRLLERNAGRAPIIGVTNTPGSPLGTRATAVLLVHAGEESAVACKTYVATVVALRALGAVLGGEDLEAVRVELRAVVPAVAAYLESWREHVAACADLAERARSVFLAGRGPSLAAVLTGGLISKESTHVPAEGMSTAAFRHGPMDMLGPEVLALIFSGDSRTRALNIGLCDELQARGRRAELVGEDAPHPALAFVAVSDSVRPVLEILPVQMLTLGLAAISGIEAGRFALVPKVTATE